jgi:hypothetical protein
MNKKKNTHLNTNYHKRCMIHGPYDRNYLNQNNENRRRRAAELNEIKKKESRIRVDSGKFWLHAILGIE